jgi:hypothetical protein
VHSTIGTGRRARRAERFAKACGHRTLPITQGSGSEDDPDDVLAVDETHENDRTAARLLQLLEAGQRVPLLSRRIPALTPKEVLVRLDART